MQGALLDVVIIGAGPAGSTAGHLLAAAGHHVLILDKEDFPRFHIGESLLPCDLPIFDKLGIDLSRGPFLHKQGAEFLDEETGEHAFYNFADALPGGNPHAYQVERSAFDAELLRLAERAGARVELGVRVRDVSFDDHGVTTSAEGRDYRSRYVIDATGQDAFMGRRRKALSPIREVGRSAVFRHFAGLSDEAWARVSDRGNIKVLVRPDGWLWVIPLSGRRLSVGFVSHQRAIDAADLDEAVERSPLLAECTAGVDATPHRHARNFSYKNRAARGPRYACVGDAACFIDPVFSSGVSLAMLGAERLAQDVSSVLSRGTEHEPDAARAAQEHMVVAYRSMGALVYSFYHTALVKNLFFARNPDPALRSGLVSILAGDVWRADNRFQEMILKSSRRAMSEDFSV